MPQLTVGKYPRVKTLRRLVFPHAPSPIITNFLDWPYVLAGAINESFQQQEVESRACLGTFNQPQLIVHILYRRCVAGSRGALGNRVKEDDASIRADKIKRNHHGHAAVSPNKKPHCRLPTHVPSHNIVHLLLLGHFLSIDSHE